MSSHVTGTLQHCVSSEPGSEFECYPMGAFARAQWCTWVYTLQLLAGVVFDGLFCGDTSLMVIVVSAVCYYIVLEVLQGPI